MSLVLNYESKKALASQIGKRLDYTETSMFGKEYTANGKVFGSNRPHITGFKREFYAIVTMHDGLIAKVD
jgi:hypothetical protein